VSPWTLPSTASIFTGLYPSQHNVDKSSPFLDGNYTTMAESFKNLNYQTLCITGNNWLNEHSKFDRGFDHFLKVWQVFQISEDPIGRRGIQRYENPIKDVLIEMKKGNIFKNIINSFYAAFIHKKSDYGAKKINGLFKDWVNNRKTHKPFFACLFYLEPHLKYRPKREFAEKYLPKHVNYKDALQVNQDAWAYICGNVKMKKEDFEILTSLYDAELSYTDQLIGELFQFLKDQKIYEDSLIIVTADHGENIGDHNLMDHQYCLFDTLLKIPLIIKFPNSKYVGKVDNIVESIDILPGITDFVKENELNGNLSQAKDSGKIFAYSEYLEPQPSMEVMKKKYGCLKIDRFDRQLKAIRSSQYKLIVTSKGEKDLYDIRSDPFEINNIIETNSEVVNNLENELFKFGEFKNVVIKKELEDKIKKRLESLGYI
jgi:arylsulfatase A-like enzyme